MADSTLTVTHPYIRRVLGDFFGYTDSIDAWSSDEAFRVEECLRRGLRRFYFQPFLPGATGTHEWSFLKNCIATLSLTDGDNSYALPDDFFQLAGAVCYAAGTNPTSGITIVDESQIRRWQSVDTTTHEAQPRYVAVRPLTATPSASSGQRWEAIFYPTPGASYTVNYAYEVIPGMITTAAPYPHGSALHGETILNACEAAAEYEISRQPGPAEQRYLMALAASISKDMKQTRSRNLGYNGNRALMEEPTRNELRGTSTFTNISGVEY